MLVYRVVTAVQPRRRLLRASYAPTTHATRSRQQITNTLSSVNGKNKLKVSLSDTGLLFLLHRTFIPYNRVQGYHKIFMEKILIFVVQEIKWLFEAFFHNNI